MNIQAKCLSYNSLSINYNMDFITFYCCHLMYTSKPLPRHGIFEFIHAVVVSFPDLNGLHLFVTGNRESKKGESARFEENILLLF